jgi:hypothetical protein
MEQLEVSSNGNRLSIFLCDSVDVGEDMVEVNGISPKEVEPF